jgi:AhpD family alkylhydroperoxidase
MSRIEPRQGVFARLVARGSRAAYGREMKSAGVFAQHPRLMVDYMRFNRAAERGKRVPKALSELAVTKAATIVGCEFCMDISSEYARRAGLSDQQLLALHEAHDSGLFSDDELRRRVGIKGTLELVQLIAWENARARTNVALDIGPEGFSEGKACAIPDRLGEPVSGYSKVWPS